MTITEALETILIKSLMLLLQEVEAERRGNQSRRYVRFVPWQSATNQGSPMAFKTTLQQKNRRPGYTLGLPVQFRLKLRRGLPEKAYIEQDHSLWSWMPPH